MKITALFFLLAYALHADQIEHNWYPFEIQGGGSFVYLESLPQVTVHEKVAFAFTPRFSVHAAGEHSWRTIALENTVLLGAAYRRNWGPVGLSVGPQGGARLLRIANYRNAAMRLGFESALRWHAAPRIGVDLIYRGAALFDDTPQYIQQVRLALSVGVGRARAAQN